MIVKNMAYEISEYDKVYETSISYSLRPDKVNITSPKKNSQNIENIYNPKTTLNNRDYYIAGRYVKARTGLIRSINHLISSDKKYYKILVSIEIEHEKPLYSDFHSELNIVEPIPLKEDGDIVSDYKDISWNESFEHFATSWNGLCLPEKVYGD